VFVTLDILSSQIAFNRVLLPQGERWAEGAFPLGFGLSAFDVVDVPIPLTLTLVLSLRERKFLAKPDS
jgi:hypothetical protein